MGKGSQRITARADSENNCLSSCEAHDVSSSSKEDRGVPAGQMGKSKAAEEGCLAAGA